MTEQIVNQELCKKSLNDVVVGDVVIVSSYGRTSIATVEKTLKTQIIVNGRRYVRQTGREYGSINSRTSIDAPLSTVYGTTFLDRHYELIADRELAAKKNPYVKFISQIQTRELNDLQLEVLKQAAELIGYVESEQ